jgi:transcription elongation factor Elf1
MASRVDHKFTCPVCGSKFWGASNVGYMNAKIHCHGDVDEFRSCKFTAPYNDLYKYSTFTIKPDSLEMYTMLSLLENRAYVAEKF